MQIRITSWRQVAAKLLAFLSCVIGQKGQTCNHGHLGGGNGRLFINLGCTMGVPLQHSRVVFLFKYMTFHLQ